MIDIMVRGTVSEVRMEKGTLVIVLQILGLRGRLRTITCSRKGATAQGLRRRIRHGQTLVVRGSSRQKITSLYALSVTILDTGENRTNVSSPCLTQILRA